MLLIFNRSHGSWNVQIDYIVVLSLYPTWGLAPFSKKKGKNKRKQLDSLSFEVFNNYNMYGNVLPYILGVLVNEGNPTAGT